MFPILILTALLPEAQAIARALSLTPHKHAPNTWHDRATIQLKTVGIRAAHLPPIQDVKAILLAGLAGGISPQLHVGDILIDGNLHNLALPFPFTQGPIHTSKALISTPTEKQSLYQKTACLAVDMETDHVRQFAHTHNAQFLTLRTISDAASDHLDPALLTLVDPLGRPRVTRAIGMLCIKPWKLKAMLRLKKNADLALKNLGVAVAGLLAAGWPHTKENAAQ